VYATIQAAIDASEDGEVVVVLPGTYRESINFIGKAITVQSTNPGDPDVVDATVIQGMDPGRPVVTFARGEAEASTLAGFTIRFVSPYSGLELSPCCGGGIYVREASPTIRDNRVVGHEEGAVYLVESGAKLTNNRIIDNTSSEPGGAIVVNCYTRSPVITGNLFENNSAPFGGAIYITSPSASSTPANAAPTVVHHNTFRNNTARGSGTAPAGGGAIFVEFGGHLELASPDDNSYSNNVPNDVFYVIPPRT
jgi:parallel beta-helix repeat protein